MNVGTLRVALLLSLGLVPAVVAQTQFELTVPGSSVASRAELGGERLRIEDAQGNVTIYRRDRRHDAPDGSLLGYTSDSARQVIRWPTSGRGRMQIAADNRSGQLVFRPSQMEIRALATVAVAIQDVDPQSAYRFVPTSPQVASKGLAVDADGNVVLRGMQDDDRQSWHLVALGSSVFRIHNDAWGRRWSLAGRPEDGPRLARTSDSPDQLWRLVASAGSPGELVCANVGVAGRVLACGATGLVAVQPRHWGAGCGWRLEKIRIGLPPIFADYRFVSREVRSNPALPPAQVELTNSHSKELWVLLVDRLQGGGGLRLKVPAGKSTTIALERDPGAALVEVFERGLPNGLVQRDELVTALPPAPRYDASVYELIVQSIAIDATVRGGKLEDVQHAPRSIGWFEFPPGDLLPDGPLDVYDVAKAQQNPGQVRRIDPQQWQPGPAAADPVESLLNKFRPKADP
jgi:hypothetical protein